MEHTHKDLFDIAIEILDFHEDSGEKKDGVGEPVVWVNEEDFNTVLRNMRSISHCVNLYHELVEALKNIAMDRNGPAIHEKTIEEQSMSWQKQYDYVTRIAQAVLKKAGEQ
jgi:hypothetical protein